MKLKQCATAFRMSIPSMKMYTLKMVAVLVCQRQHYRFVAIPVTISVISQEVRTQLLWLLVMGV